jgi:Flp pilus assembly protein TadD
VLVLSGVSYRQIGFWHDSESLWTRAIAVTSGNYTAHSNLANALAIDGRSDDAIAQFEAAEAMHPYPPEQLLAVGLYDQQHGHLEGAIQQFTKAAQSSDQALRSTAMANLGSIYLQTGRRNLAALSFSQAMQANPSDPVALVGAGLLAFPASGETAVELFDRAVTIQPTDVRLLLLSAALEKVGRKVDARTASDRARRASANIEKAQSAATQLLKSAAAVSN